MTINIIIFSSCIPSPSQYNSHSPPSVLTGKQLVLYIKSNFVKQVDVRMLEGQTQEQKKKMPARRQTGLQDS